MRRVLWFLGLALFAATPASAPAGGLVIPVDREIPPLAMLNQRVSVTLEDQVAVTSVKQTFRNHTDRNLEATYVFPVPKGAGVRDFAMIIDGKRVKGELVEAVKARQIYTDIVRRTHDPGLLEYIGADLLQMKIFPIPPRSDQAIELSYTSIAPRENELVEYTFPLRTAGRALTTLQEFSLNVTLKSSAPILNIYSPTHTVGFTRKSDREANVTFEKSQAVLDRDFRLYYTTSTQDIGVTALQHRPIAGENGYVLLLISPRAELSKDQQVPRDLVFVLDTSGSMREEDKIGQAKKALKHGLTTLGEKDRFALINFATTVNSYRDGLVPATKDHLAQAAKWIDGRDATGGTAINDALAAALALRTNDPSRSFIVVFLTDGKPTIGETNPDKILAAVGQKNSAHTRIFTFGVGNDLNATFLDQLAEQTRAASSFVRPDEDIELKTSGFFTKISRPALTDLKLAASGGVQLSEVYPPRLPDLFHGGQIVVLGRYHGASRGTITVTGQVGSEARSFTYDVDFVTKSEDKPFVEEIWARRKVGYLLDQIRLNGEKKELVDEVTALAKKYGIATPYTSYLIVPDGGVPLAGGAGGGGNAAAFNPGLPARPPGLDLGRGGGKGSGFGGAGDGSGQSKGDGKVADLAKRLQKEQSVSGGSIGQQRGAFEEGRLADANKGGQAGKAQREAESNMKALKTAEAALRAGDLRRLQSDRLGVDLSVQTNQLKNQSQLQARASRVVANRNCVEIGGVWIDDAFTDKAPLVTVKAQGDAYFRILERHPHVRHVYQLGNFVVWLTPSGTALVIDMNDGAEKLTDAEIDRLFVQK